MSDVDTYRALYIAESRENHENIVKNLLVLESGTDEGAIAEIFRSAHSLKGMSASMGFSSMEHLCHRMEDVFDEIRNGSLHVTPPLIDILLASADDIETMLDDIESGGQGDVAGLSERIHALEAWTKEKPVATPPETPVADVYAATPAWEAGESPEGTERYQVRIRIADNSTSKNLRGMIVLQNIEEIGKILSFRPSREVIEDQSGFDGTIELVVETDAGDEALRQVSSGSEIAEVVVGPAGPAPAAGGPAERSEDAGIGEAPAGPLSPTLTPQPDSQDEKSKKTDKREVKNIRVDIGRLDQMMNLVEDLVINRGRITQIAKKYEIKELDETLSMVGRSVADLQNLMMEIRMIPLNHIFNRFPRTVRDLANREGKEVDFIMEGGETELDRSVMDGLNDPLLHLIRNAIDHGIESPDRRVASGKTPKGTVRLSARRESDNVIITIEDDGGGINTERVRDKAVDRGLLSAEAATALPRDEVYQLMFLPGFSTAETVTDVSGRGVGLDVVRTAIEGMKGTVKIDSTPGSGTRFELVLPPTMAIVNVMMVRVSGKRFAIPVNNIVEVAGLTGISM
ncbi:MAG: chemotaxis protein CheA, partial [Methanoregulaceae archaeon]|nr:chemotaxis protein CheA [Methanoregulaceae archaeon]